MNTLNYCTKEAAQKLVDAVIVLETDFVWSKTSVDTWELRPAKWKKLLHSIPAPSPAEVWRELPHNTWLRKDYTGLTNIMNEDNSFIRYNTNLTDALIDLLIWVRKEKK